MLHTQLKQTDLENCIHISTESSKEGFNGTVFQHFTDTRNPDVRMELCQAPVFLCLCSIYLVNMLRISLR